VSAVVQSSLNQPVSENQRMKIAADSADPNNLGRARLRRRQDCRVCQNPLNEFSLPSNFLLGCGGLIDRFGASTKLCRLHNLAPGTSIAMKAVA